MIAKRYDILAFGAHPDDLEAVMGETATKLAAKGRSILFVALCDGEATRYGQTWRAYTTGAQSGVDSRRGSPRAGLGEYKFDSSS
jgi:LmbE family N-acetylglucosaminyl deacetylase